MAKLKYEGRIKLECQLRNCVKEIGYLNLKRDCPCEKINSTWEEKYKNRGNADRERQLDENYFELSKRLTRSRRFNQEDIDNYKVFIKKEMDKVIFESGFRDCNLPRLSEFGRYAIRKLLDDS